jgi:hypothetical protein
MVATHDAMRLTALLESKMMTKAADDVDNRRPVWEALSDLFLDTDVSLARNWRIKKLAESPYSLAELEVILVDEVYPACIGNLLCVAGGWSGFDQCWLEQRILRHSHARWTIRLFNLGRLTVPFWSEWRATKAGVAAKRAGMQG